MKFLRCWILVTSAASLVLTTAAAQTGFPFQDESLRYSINWPSGLSLGDANLTARHSTAGWDFEMTLDAGIPGFAVADKFHSAVNSEVCSLEFDRNTSHGNRKTREKTIFDYRKGVAHRTTLVPAGGGKSELDISACARDALALVYFARRELGQGRVPPQQPAFFGSSYLVRMDYTGAQTIMVGDKRQVSDHLVVYVKGPKSETSFEIFYARDAARTPLLIKAPFSVATFSMELVR